MDRFKDWDESVVDEFLRVAEEALRRPMSVDYVNGYVDDIVALVREADYSDVRASLRENESRTRVQTEDLQRQLDEVSTERNILADLLRRMLDTVQTLNETLAAFFEERAR